MPSVTAPTTYAPPRPAPPLRAAAQHAPPCVCQVLFTAELQRRLGPGSGVLCFVLHPGEVLTGIARSLPAPLERLYVSLFSRILLSPSEGAAHRGCLIAGPADTRACIPIFRIPPTLCHHHIVMEA